MCGSLASRLIIGNLRGAPLGYLANLAQRMVAAIGLFSSIHLEFLGVVVHDPPSPSIIEIKRCKSSKEEEKQQSIIRWRYLARQQSQRGRALTYVRRQVLLRWHNGALRRDSELERWRLWQLSWQSCNLWSQQWSGPFWARLSFCWGSTFKAAIFVDLVKSVIRLSTGCRHLP